MANNKRLRLIAVLLFFCVAKGEAIELQYQPWLGPYLEFEFRSSLLLQHYQDVASTSKLRHYSSNDLFLDFSLNNSIDPRFSLGVEATLAKTREQDACVDNLRVHGRYALLDDVAGEDMAVTVGAIFTYAFENSLKDMSSFHHARGETEVYLSVGQECSGDYAWFSRWWVVTGIGTGMERGSPWLRANAEYESRLCGPHEWGMFVRSLWGLGHRRLCPHDFHGYGPVQHQSIDVGLRYTYLIEFFGNLSAEYSYRPYARNFPAHTHRFLISLLYTFGL